MRSLQCIMLLVVAFFFSCDKRDKMYSNKDITFYAQNDFKVNRELVSKKLSKISDSLFSPSRMNIVGGYLVILDRKSERPIHVIDLKKDKYLGAFVKKGQGPNELHIPWKMSQINDNSLLVYDVGGKKILGFNMDSLISNNSSFLEKKINEEGICSSVQIIDNNIYYTNDLDSKNRVFKLDTINNEIKGIGTLLNNYNKVTDINFAQACRGSMSYKNNNFVFSYLFAPYFEIYDVKNNIWTSIMAIDKFSPIIKEVETDGYKRFSLTKETKLGFIDICMSDRYIYMLYSGEKALREGHNIDEAKSILVFDYKGNPKEIFELDSYISSFSVFDDSIIYGITNDIKAELVQFEIK